ncbi:serine/threonine-protein kinase/endoribonuclease IRE1 (ERN1) [Vairimorpha necatrix]|uniref:Serine/threonine-protein kinase/endoribonuclease IRE1 (ERN1) n=1 Tax=Vairimorpha necatrix TaxID=6039 RepID=A0AAX4JEX6_9MICR
MSSLFYILHLIFIQSVFSLNIVQTDNNILHFIEDDYMEKFEINKLKSKTPALPIAVGDKTTIQTSYKSIIDNIIISNDGLVTYENFSFNIDSLQGEPKICNYIIFQTQRRCETILKFNTIIFMVFIDLKIMDSRTLYTRIETFSYIYFPFSTAKNINVSEKTVWIHQKEYTFDENIVAVYDVVKYKGTNYMNRIYSNSGIQLYTPKYNIEKISYLKYWAILILPIFLIYWYRPKNIKLSTLDYETSNYKIYKGVYNSEKAIIKKFKRRDTSYYKEISILNKIDHPSIKKILYSENSYFKPTMVFEYSERVSSLSKNDLYQFVQVILYLVEQKIFYKNFSPINFRRKNGRFILFNIYSDDDTLGWYLEDDKYASTLQSVGIILHYFMTGYHPYDIEEEISKKPKFFYIKNQEDIKFNEISNTLQINENNLKKYDKADLKEIENNMKIRKYKLRTVMSLEHDLIYHTIKNSTTIIKLSKHPYFWSHEKIFNFLANYSDIVEGSSSQTRKLERNKSRIFEMPWNNFLENVLLEELEIFRTYNYNNAKDLIRVIRNKGRHYNQIPEAVKDFYQSFPVGFVDYWTGVFPRLLIVCYNCGESLKDNELIKDYY